MATGIDKARQVQKLTMAADVVSPSRTLAENVDVIATLPLMHQPGEAWEYGVSTDVLARIFEIVEGARVSEILQSRIFDPLGMADTAFFTPEDLVTRKLETRSHPTPGGYRTWALERSFGFATSSRKLSGASGYDTQTGEAKLDLRFLNEAIQEGRTHRFWLLTTYTTLTNYQHSLGRIRFSAAAFS